MPYKRDSRRHPWPLFTAVKDTAKSYESGRGPLHQKVTTLMPRTCTSPASRTVSNIFLMFTNHPACGSLLQQLKKLIHPAKLNGKNLLRKISQLLQFFWQFTNAQGILNYKRQNISSLLWTGRTGILHIIWGMFIQLKFEKPS